MRAAGPVSARRLDAAPKWCGDEITTREATRLPRQAEDDQEASPRWMTRNRRLARRKGRQGSARAAVRGAAASRPVVEAVTARHLDSARAALERALADPTRDRGVTAGTAGPAPGVHPRPVL